MLMFAASLNAPLSLFNAPLSLFIVRDWREMICKMDLEI